MTRLYRATGGCARFVCTFLLLSLVSVSSAIAQSAGCTALNNATFSTATFAAQAYQSSQFDAGDTLTLTFTDSGAGVNSDNTNTDSFSLTNYGMSTFSTYYPTASSGGTAGTHTYTVTGSQLVSAGLRFRITTSHGYLSPLTVSCTSATSASTDASLSALSASQGSLSPAFSSGTSSYNVVVANSVTRISLTPTTRNNTATVTVNGVSVTSGSASGAVALSEGNNTLSVVVTAGDGTTTSAYTVVVQRSGLAPVAGSDSTSVAFNSSNNAITLPLSGGTATSVAVTSPPAHGSVVITGTTATYTPVSNYSGTDTFTYTASNNWGTSAPATVSIHVTNVTLSFTPASGTLSSATVGTPWSQTITASSGTSPYTYSASGLPAGRTISASTGEISGTPTASGSYTIQVSAADNAGITGTVSYQITVTGQAPVVSAVSSTVVANTRENLIEPVLSGGAVTSLAIVQQPAHGTARIQSLKIRYTPAAGYSGSDSFIYSASNNFGAAQATVTLNVTATTLAFTPASGALPEGRAGTAYRQTFGTSGGTAPYQYRISGVLPAGLALAGDTLSGTPAAAGNSNFTLTATDASGASGQVTYTLNIISAEPVGASHAASVLAGKSVRVNLTESATGGPFTGARLVDLPPKTSGNATIQQSENSVYLDFDAASQASGTVALRYVLLTQDSQSAPATVTFTIAGRPDPSKDPDVLGLVSAQIQSAQNFARAQIRNFSDRLETLHNTASVHSGMNGIRFNMPSSKKERGPDDTLWNSAWENNRQPSELPQMTDKTSAQHPLNSNNSRINYWTGGFVDFGHSDKDGVSFSHTLVGISTGADYQFTPEFTAGMGIGFGRDVSDIGDSGSRSNGRSVSSAFYGSYHPDNYFIDGLLGYSRLDYDSRRYVTEMDHFARGDRGGYQVFGAVTTGYDYRLPDLLISPYGRLQLSRTHLNSYTESNADAYDLAFASQVLNDVTGAVGIRTQYALPLTWSMLRWQSRIEYAHAFSDQGRARLGYADSGNDSWSADVSGDSQENIVLGMGLDFLLPHNITPGIAYQGTLGLDDARSRSQMIMIRVNIGF
ncbi:autotransporter domain-containing protein [Rahnella sp. AA]|uniref:autotransporter family protein n=1 Tax=Rahnella sp. AA TaxID=2057180 RepID=UPI000C32036D|nr:autotransporter domain-containing protein [Rahnella sp. AA]PKE29589.1 autotransporter domain-containing protein [Rahnella sp. AA]